ncbi:MAG: MFS transporter [Candidatus Heimdallarchaeota archaeon]|nr:MFS transporter [Candidatus Heimdallarchaeota archaeon]
MPDTEPSGTEKQTIASTIPLLPLTEGIKKIPGSVDLSDDELIKIPDREKVYGRSALATFSYGMVDPFLTTIAVDMGATGGEMGWLRAVTNLLGNFVQPLFGFLSDRIQRRAIFVALSNILYSSIWILLLFVNKVTMIIVIAGVISLVVSLGTPAWMALLGEITPAKVRGKIIANLNWFSQLPYILSTILGGVLFNYIAGVFSIGSWVFPRNYFFPILFGLIAGLASAFVILSFKEKKAKERAQHLNILLHERELKSIDKTQKTLIEPCVIKSVLAGDRDPHQISNSNTKTVCVSAESIIERRVYRKRKTAQVIPSSNRILVMLRNKPFMKFTIIFGIQSFFMSMCWPLFPIRQREDIGADFLQIAIFSVVMSTATLSTIRYSGRVSDLIGRKPQMVMNRLILAAMPLGYMFASQVWHVILFHAVICIPLGLNSAVLEAYLIDVTPEKERSMYIGFYNMFYGLILFLGSLFGGYLLDFLMGDITIFGFTPVYTQYKAITIALAVGFIGRVITALPFISLKEVRKFPYKFKDLPKFAVRSKRLLPLVITISFYFGITCFLIAIFI